MEIATNSVLNSQKKKYILAITPGMWLRQWYDLLHRDSDNDFLSTAGFMVALRDTLRCKPGALWWSGHPCNPLLGNKTKNSCSD